MKNSSIKIGIAGYGVIGKIRRKIIDKISGVKTTSADFSNISPFIYSIRILDNN